MVGRTKQAGLSRWIDKQTGFCPPPCVCVPGLGTALRHRFHMEMRQRRGEVATGHREAQLACHYPTRPHFPLRAGGEAGCLGSQPLTPHESSLRYTSSKWSQQARRGADTDGPQRHLQSGALERVGARHYLGTWGGHKEFMSRQPSTAGLPREGPGSFPAHGGPQQVRRMAKPAAGRQRYTLPGSHGLEGKKPGEPGLAGTATPFLHQLPTKYQLSPGPATSSEPSIRSKRHPQSHLSIHIWPSYPSTSVPASGSQGPPHSPQPPASGAMNLSHGYP